MNGSRQGIDLASLSTEALFELAMVLLDSVFSVRSR